MFIKLFFFNFFLQNIVQLICTHFPKSLKRKQILQRKLEKEVGKEAKEKR